MCAARRDGVYWKYFMEGHMSEESDTETQGEGCTRYILLTGIQKVVIKSCSDWKIHPCLNIYNKN